MGLFRKLFKSFSSPTHFAGARLLTKDGEKIDISTLSSRYNFNTLKMRPEGGHIYLLDSYNTSVALSELNELNRLIRDAKTLCSELPKRNFTEKQFEKQRYRKDYTDYYTLQLFFNPLTKKKKEVSKFPYVVSFFANDKLFVDVSYDKSGAIGKAEFTIWGDICYIVNAVSQSGTLRIKSIYKNDWGYKEKVYPQ